MSPFLLLFVAESETAHNVSKFLGGEGIINLATAGLGAAGAGARAAGAGAEAAQAVRMSIQANGTMAAAVTRTAVMPATAAAAAGMTGTGVVAVGQIYQMSTGVEGGGAGSAPRKLRDPDTGRYVEDPANPPSPYEMTDAQRRAAWKKLAQDPDSPLTPAQRAEIQARGWRGPQRVNAEGEIETMELSHEPIPLREGGTEVVPRWPEDHAAIDPHRHLKK